MASTMPTLLLFILAISSAFCTPNFQQKYDVSDEQLNSIKQAILTVNNGIPPGVICNATQVCDNKKVCTSVCARGTVEIPKWQQEAIALQNKLARRRPFCQTQILGTHNSAITLADGYGNQDQVLTKIIQIISKSTYLQTNNQYFSLTDQLRLGVRLIEVDVHWVLDELRIAHCGGVHSGAVDKLLPLIRQACSFLHLDCDWDTETIGCNPSLSSIPARMQRSAESALLEIKEWMDLPENKEEFVMIFFDDQPDLLTWGKVALLEKMLTDHFNGTIFTPADYKAHQGFPTMEEMVQAGKRVLFLSGSDYGVAMADQIFSKYGPELCQWAEPSVNQIHADWPSCSVDLDKGGSIGPYAGIITRPQTSEIMYGPFKGGTQSTGLLTEANLPAVIACDVSIPSPDLLTPVRAASVIWSWAVGEPSQPNNLTMCTMLRVVDGRWKQEPCQTTLVPACKVENKPGALTPWVLGSVSMGTDARHACPEGTLFAAPSSAYEGQFIRSLLAAASLPAAWINYASL